MSARYPHPLAPWAVPPDRTRGRQFPERPSEGRGPFQRDRDRIIHATAFRRLKHKTQVFVAHEGDHYRTRLTHSLEVAQIARSIARRLALNEDLAEALALAHDLGHPPFGHAGEEALNQAMAAEGGFDHNAQAVRVVTVLERRYPGFDGLNLTWETLEGLAKHNGPVAAPHPRLAAFCAAFDLELDSWPSAEAQVAALSDDIAYTNHDLDDGLRAGMFALDDLRALPLAGAAIAEAEAAYPGIAPDRLQHEMIRTLIGAMVDDVVAEARARLEGAAPGSVEAVRALGAPVVAFSAPMAAANAELKAFLMARMYRHHRVNRMTAKARRVVRELFEAFRADPGCLPAEWQGGDVTSVCDYVAGMTDGYALDEHRRLFDVTTRA
ncbi:deoxyguanosinetriphosphate triphosphohydrolase [Elioraea sp.]|jgi:dGTPase|uniref:deoxyguanosinetriphosphate triphosphohydrolase n=1 Tax=Elioraea sp. TaxID=2185103 RepID=UPI0021DF0E81|nr:deoxyguanosinetriphosphate triphosphohydrolase [Elioraea sp.]GIX11127.1 MAG: deoxyguanosinetriphosphate triphosphohydrolase-like protein [Elioraea sp.]